MKSKIVLLDLSEDINRSVKNTDIFLLSSGICKFENCLILKKNIFSEKKFQIYKQKLNKILDKTSKFIKKESKDIDSNLLELFNLRNDKNRFYDKIFYILEIKKKFINYKNIEIITDDKNFFKTYKSLKFKNIRLTLIKKEITNYNCFYFTKNIIKFYAKRILFQLYIKLFLKNKNVPNKQNEACLSLFPFFYDNNKNNFYKENFLNLNFQITDETHLNNSLIENILLSKKINSLKNTISVEKYVSAISLIRGFFISLTHIALIYKINKNIIKIDNLDISTQFNNLLVQSIINYDKVFIYKSALKIIFKKFGIKKFHYILFEYNFGYFLCKNIKEFLPNVEMLGYQHGIYSERLMWQDHLKNKKDKFKYFPQKIFLKFINCIDVYRVNFKNIKISIDKIKVYEKNIKKRLQSSKSSLAFLGLHDAYQMLNSLGNLNYKKKIFVKKHPKFKSKIKMILKKNIKFLTKVNKRHDKVYLSPTSTMAYDFLNKNEKFSIINQDYLIPLNLKILDKKIEKF